MVYQAVAEYWTHDREPQYNLNVNVTLPERSTPFQINFNMKTKLNTRTSKVRRERLANKTDVCIESSDLGLHWNVHSLTVSTRISQWVPQEQEKQRLRWEESTHNYGMSSHIFQSDLIWISNVKRSIYCQFQGYFFSLLKWQFTVFYFSLACQR